MNSPEEVAKEGASTLISFMLSASSPLCSELFAPKAEPIVIKGDNVEKDHTRHTFTVRYERGLEVGVCLFRSGSPRSYGLYQMRIEWVTTLGTVSVEVDVYSKLMLLTDAYLGKPGIELKGWEKGQIRKAIREGYRPPLA